MFKITYSINAKSITLTRSLLIVLHYCSHVTTVAPLRIKVFLEVSYLTHPLTPFIMMLAEYLETVDLTLKTLVEASIAKPIGFTTHRTIIFASCQ